VATATAVFRPFDKLRTGSGRAEGTVYFVRFGGEAVKTNKKDRLFHAAAGEKALDAASINAGCVSPIPGAAGGTSTDSASALPNVP